MAENIRPDRDLQLLDASRYAAENHVALKGDLPIGVDKRSVDTWLYPQLFRMNKSTGDTPRRPFARRRPTLYAVSARPTRPPDASSPLPYG